VEQEGNYGPSWTVLWHLSPSLSYINKEGIAWEHRAWGRAEGIPKGNMKGRQGRGGGGGEQEGGREERANGGYNTY
jgi:hypothetical protein